jgi:hypothetical protein
MKRIAGTILTLIALGIFAGCGTNADTVSNNISKEAEKFKVGRRIVVTNSITDKVEFEVTGRCSFEVYDRRLDVICKRVPDEDHHPADEHCP